MAERLFSEQDFDAVSVRDIAKEANVNVAMISYYFGSKEKLLEELISRKMETSQSALKLIAADEMTPWEKIQAIVGLYVEKLMENRRFQKLVNRELSTNVRPQLRDSMMKKMSVNREFIKGVMQEGKDKGLFRDDIDPEMAMMSFFATIHHIIGTSYYSCEMFGKKTEEELFTIEFKERVKTYFITIFSNYLLIKK